jgi:hypothetical protein
VQCQQAMRLGFVHRLSCRLRSSRDTLWVIKNHPQPSSRWLPARQLATMQPCTVDPSCHPILAGAPLTRHLGCYTHGGHAALPVCTAQAWHQRQPAFQVTACRQARARTSWDDCHSAWLQRRPAEVTCMLPGWQPRGSLEGDGDVPSVPSVEPAASTVRPVGIPASTSESSGAPGGGGC